MDWEARFEMSIFKIYYRDVSDFTLELLEPNKFIDRLERGEEHAVSMVPNTGETGTGLLLTRASGANGLAAIDRGANFIHQDDSVKELCLVNRWQP